MVPPAYSVSLVWVVPEFVRGFIADYGVPLMVVVWTAISYAPYRSVPPGIPRRLFTPNPWDPKATTHWTIVQVRSFLYMMLLFAISLWKRGIMLVLL